jgi:hypothetical protein
MMLENFNFFVFKQKKIASHAIKRFTKILNNFFAGIKKCQSCRQTIYHEKWKVTPKLAEARWAHEQARNRELGEVVEFFQDI